MSDYRPTNHDYEVRPWGNFERFTHNEHTTVKIITVSPEQELSLQYHNKRDEFWRILDGSGFITIDTDRIPVKKGDSFFVKCGRHHRLASGAESLTVLEIAFGEFDEDDIVRIEDHYGRA